MRHALLDDAAEIGIDQALFGALDGLPTGEQHVCCTICTTSETGTRAMMPARKTETLTIRLSRDQGRVAHGDQE